MKTILALILCIASTMANASVVTYRFSGVFDTPTRVAPRGNPGTEPLFIDLIKQGDHFSGQFTFDTDAVATSYVLTAPNRSAVYPELNFQLTASDAFNAAFSSWRAEKVQVTDNGGGSTPYDRLLAYGGSRVDSQHALSVILYLDPANSDAFNNFRVPAGFDSFTSVSLGAYLYHSDVPVFDFVGSGPVTLTLVDPAAVPEPATALLLLAGLGGLAALRRKN